MPGVNNIENLKNENLQTLTTVVEDFEDTLRNAVKEIHTDLQVFRKVVNGQVEEVSNQILPLATTVNDLREENLQLRVEQQRLAQQVKALTKFLGLEKNEDLVAHPPTFASTRRSSSSGTAHLSRSNSLMDTEPVMAEAAHSLQQFEALLPNGVEEKAKENAKEKKNKPSLEDLSAIEDEEVLDKMLDTTTDFEERKMIRTAMRELRKKKRDERERAHEMRLQELKQKTEEEKKAKSLNAAGMTVSKTEKSADGKTVTSMSKTERITQSDGGNRTLRTTTVESSIVKKTDGGTTVVQTKSSFSSSSTSSKNVGSIFDRDDDARSSSVSALERKQAEKRKEVMRSQTLPRTSGTQARKALIEKLEKEGGSPGNPAVARVKVQRSSGCGVPNANSIKQMLLDWCRAKTRGYEHVAIQNFSSSWSDGMAFCALVHNFFPETFDYSELNPSNRRHNFEVAFTMAEKHADCPQLLDVEDMVRMKEPDWKCVYTYIQEYYRCLVQKGLVKTKTKTSS